MKKVKFLIVLTIACAFTKLTNAQLYMNSAGGVSIGSASSAPSGVGLQSYGNALFNTTYGGTGSSAYIVAENNGSYPTSASAPDYTWWNDLGTGIYHPWWANIGFTCNSTESMDITQNQVSIYCTAASTDAFISNVNQSSSSTFDLWNSSYGTGYNWRFYVNATGNAYAYNWYSLSDARLKENVNTIPDPLNKVLKLRGVNFTYIDHKAKDSSSTNPPSSSESAKMQMGLIAQEVEQVVPEVVNTGKDGFKAVAYQSLVGLLIEALKQEDKKVNDLQNMVNNCCNMGQTPASATGTNLGTTTGTNSGTSATGQATLNQNIPNPFNTTTNITCFIPGQSGSASLLIMDMTGAIKTTIPITGRNSQTITINAGQLTAGMYYYTLLVDGKEVDTKKMILTQ
ncbi:MAG TPA: tail fiber domain-containing protein [Bacteroidia bacterium]|jgi:hypothetical protein|nr:tail fiber domain-containing protein [Bacteroidia bacterium]